MNSTLMEKMNGFMPQYIIFLRVYIKPKWDFELTGLDRALHAEEEAD